MLSRSPPFLQSPPLSHTQSHTPPPPPDPLQLHTGVPRRPAIELSHLCEVAGGGRKEGGGGAHSLPVSFSFSQKTLKGVGKRQADGDCAVRGQISNTLRDAAHRMTHVTVELIP